MHQRSEFIYEWVADKLPVKVAAQLDVMRPSWRLGPWGGPLNGQKGRVEIIRDLLLAFDFTEIFETGSYRGTTTEFLAVLSGLPVRSVEAVERNFYFAQRRLAGVAGASVELSDSRSFLRRHAQMAPTTPVFFYLDAHWEEDLPLVEELNIISNSWENAVVVIDDFQVPDDASYVFDDYGPGKRLTPELLDASNVSSWPRLYPSMQGTDETGARSGCVVLCSPHLAGTLTRVSSLRSIPITESG